MSENLAIVAGGLLALLIAWGLLKTGWIAVTGVARWSDECMGTRLRSGGGWLLRCLWRLALTAAGGLCLIGALVGARNTVWLWLAFFAFAALEVWSFLKEAARQGDIEAEVMEARRQAVMVNRQAFADNPNADSTSATEEDAERAEFAAEVEAADRAEAQMRGVPYVHRDPFRPLDHLGNGYSFDEWRREKRRR
ncbi:hypothetical protein [Paraburkholderia sediminicola]|uniref:hypothetical protein n=1 Tax=Paraburkholderia sediminicola TaxID=458836 RepID=UPI0038B6BDEE